MYMWLACSMIGTGKFCFMRHIHGIYYLVIFQLLLKLLRRFNDYEMINSQFNDNLNVTEISCESHSLFRL